MNVDGYGSVAKAFVQNMAFLSDKVKMTIRKAGQSLSWQVT